MWLTVDMAELLLKWRVRKLTGHCGERSFSACLCALRIVLLCGGRERREGEKREERRGEESGERGFERWQYQFSCYVKCMPKYYSFRPWNKTRKMRKKKGHTYWSLLEANGCSPHECDATEVNEAAISQNVRLFRNLEDWGGREKGEQGWRTWMWGGVWRGERKRVVVFLFYQKHQKHQFCMWRRKSPWD